MDDDVNSRVGRVADFLRTTTTSSIQYLECPELKFSGLLAGRQIEQLWNAIQRNRVPRGKYVPGLYFYFYQQSGGTLVPLYVGKAEKKLQERALHHLGLAAYFDQVMRFHLGAVHGVPFLLTEERLERMRRDLDPIRLGLVVGEVCKFEKAFQGAVHPVADGECYPRADPPYIHPTIFSMGELADRWSAGHSQPRGSATCCRGGALGPLPDLDDLSRLHARFKDGQRRLRGEEVRIPAVLGRSETRSSGNEPAGSQ
jgi:hypothetical protein